MFQNIITINFFQQEQQNLICPNKARAFLFLTAMLSFSVCAEDGHKLETRPAASLWYQELAEQGDVDAKYNLGMMNEVGWSVPVNIQKAIRWYREAAKEGHAEAQVRLGMIYYLGLGSRKSKLKGESWIRKAAKQEHKFAMSLKNKFFAEDVPESIDKIRILGKVRKVYLQNEDNGISRLYQLVDEARREITKQQQAKEDSTIRERREIRVAEGKTGDKKVFPQEEKKEAKRIESIVPEFIESKSLEENRTLVRGNIETIRLQAKKGHASAQYNLGRMHELGIKVPANKVIALDWYKKSAEQGYADAQYRLAISMLYGKDTDHNERVGRKWLSLAAENGHKAAQNLLNNMADQEDIGAGNSLALTWYLDRAVAGDAEASFSLGKIFEHGWGVKSDLFEAVRWYKHAAMLGAKNAEVKLHDIKTRQTQIQKGLDGAGDTTNNFNPSDWLAYMVAVLLAIGIIFWPFFKLINEKNKIKKIKKYKVK